MKVFKGNRIRTKRKARKINFDADRKVPRVEFKVSAFKELINSGLHYICVACNCKLYKTSVVFFPRDRYSVISDNVFRHATVFDKNFTYARHVKRNFLKKCIPCQAVFTIFEVSELPKEFRDIQRLESVLLAKTTTF